MKKYLIRWQLGALIATAVLILAGCGSSGGGETDAPAAPENTASDASASFTPEEGTFTVGLTYIPDVQFSPLYVAEANGYFKDRGLSVTLRHHGQQESLLGALESGEEDVVFAGADEMMQARSTGIDVVNWATMYQQYPVVLIVREDSGIQSWADMAGKTVGMPGPYGENYYGWLAAQNLNELGDSVTAANIGYTQTAAIANGEVDGVIGFVNNDPIAMKNAGVPVRTIPLVDGDLPLIGVGFGSLSSNVRPEAYSAFLDAIREAIEFSLSDPEAALDITTKYVPSLAEPEQRKVAGEVLQATLQLYMGSDIFGSQDEATWAAMADFLLEQGIITTPVSASDAFTQEVLNLGSFEWAAS